METLKVGQMCYLEKHRVYEMFRNIIKALVMCQPEDHLSFIVWYLKHKRHVDVPKVILVFPPRLRVADVVHIAQELSKSTGAVPIDRRNVLKRFRRKQGGDECSTDFIKALTEYMQAKRTPTKGWLLLSIPNSGAEAEKLISLGILPTHTIVLKDTDGDQKKVCKFNQGYNNFELEIKIKFRSTLKEMFVSDKSNDEIVELCLDEILRQKSSAAPFIPRVTLIGPRGSKRFVTANAISKKFDLVHVDFDKILIQKKVDNNVKIPEETIHLWLKEKITENDCVEKGYVLTGFPRTRNDFEWLDSLEIAPNRVIFLAIDFRDIYSRLSNRCIDTHTGTFMSADQAADELKAGTLNFKHLARYPLNSKKLISELSTYCKHLKDMLYYCGDNCSVVTVDESLCDKILECIKSGSPAASPRSLNCKPSRLTDILYKKMFLSYNEFYKNTYLTEKARNLLNALEHKAKKDVPVSVNNYILP